MIIKKLDDNILYYENVLEDPYGFIESIERLEVSNPNISHIGKWEKWNASNAETKYGITKNGTFSNMQYSTSEDIETSLISYRIKAISDLCFANYKKTIGVDVLKLPDYFSIRKYDTNADMGKHVDSEDPTDKSHPVVSGVLYLNDDYEGGEIYFPEQNIKIKPKAGSMIMFPSYRPYFHHPLEITKGNKYMVPFFWYPLETVWE
jgi:predicted 2-oxoglutarate/Fe(II)-dependent dioxygenase YbiX